MSKPFSDPSLLTKDRLKRELEKNGVKLPRGDQKKEVYVNLYLENLSPKSARRVGNGEFSSDDEVYEESPRSKQIVQRSSRTISKAGSKDIVGSDITSLSNSELKDELTDLGQSVGPIMPSTRDLYERKLARLRATSQNNGETVTTVSKTEFSDNDFDEEEVREEEYVPEDEFFYKHSRRSHGDPFGGSTFTKNVQNSSVQKEVTRDVSMSSSRNIEHSSTVDHKTMNKVRNRKGDKKQERSWSTAAAGRSASDSRGATDFRDRMDVRHGADDDESYDHEGAIPALPPSVQRALTSARRLTPEKEEQQPRQLRGRIWKQNTEDVSKRTSSKTAKEKPKETTIQQTKQKSKKWWLIVLVILILIALTCAVVYNLERLPEVKRASLPFVTTKKNSTS